MTKKLREGEKWARKWERKYTRLKPGQKVDWNDWANMWQAIGYLSALCVIKEEKIQENK